MLTPHHSDALLVAQRRGREFRAAAAAERHLGPRRHPALAAVLRWTADRLDPAAPLARRPVSQA